MYYFKWFGYTQEEKPQLGYSACSNEQELLFLLQQEGIQGVHMQEIRYNLLSPCTFAERQAVLNELSQLLQAHIRLSQALAIISSLVKKEYTRQVLLFCMRSVDQGKSFPVAAAQYPALFDTLTIHALKAGHDSGLLAVACTHRAQQLMEIAAIRSKVRAALAMPLITALFFVTVLVFLMAVILPQFKKIFLMLKSPLPASTQSLLAISDHLNLFTIISGLGFLVLILLLLFGFSRTIFGKKVYDYLLLGTPLAGPLYKDLARAQCLQSISLLLRSGQTLSQALRHAAESFTHSVIKAELMAVQQDVQKGKPFFQAICLSSLLAVPEVVNSVTIAHETAQLEILLQQLSGIFRARALKKLDKITLFIQPILFIVIGAGIGFLLLALYLPLLQIPQTF